MAKKPIRATRPDSENEPQLTEAQSKTIEQQIKAITEKGKKKGYLTYEEMNEQLSDEAISPARLDSLLATLDEMGISLLDEADVEKGEEEKFEVPEESLEEEAEAPRHLDEDEIIEKELVTPEVARRIDDPIRMYLTQMGEIPLLTREKEIALARKIEMARLIFRRKMLECDYCAKGAVEILNEVEEGILSFDRTMKISTAENLVRGVIKRRLPQNITTVNELMKRNQALFKKSLDAQDPAQQQKITKQLRRNRRKIAALLEELSLRTSRIQPMKTKLHGMLQKMRQLEQIIAAGTNKDYTSEDIGTMKQELGGPAGPDNGNA